MNVPDHPIQCPEDLFKRSVTNQHYLAYHNGYLDDIYDQGFKAALAGDDVSDCPYVLEEEHYPWIAEEWVKGFEAGQEHAEKKDNE